LLRILALTATLGTLGGAGGGTLAAVLHRPAPHVPRVQIALGEPGQANGLGLSAVGLAAGDRLQRTFDLGSLSSAPIAVVALSSAANPSSLLDRDRVNGLQLRIDRCSKTWHESPQPYRYTCSGKQTQVVARRPVIGTGVPLAGLAGLKRAKTAHLLLTVELPQSAPNALQGRQSQLTYTFTAVQAGTRR
jgi:spore coat-associated protein N